MKIKKQLPSEIPNPTTDNIGYIFIDKNTNVLKVKTRTGIISYNSNDATAISTDILSGKTAYNNGQMVSGTIQTYSGITSVSPSNSIQTLSTTGKYMSSNITIAAVSNLTASNIKAGTTIGGVTGTFTSDANATINDLIKGKTAYVNGVKITGTYEIPTE
jgi:hypothetical protein